MSQPVLNETFHWFDDTSFQNSRFSPAETQRVRRAFRGIPRRVLLNPGEFLYRFKSNRFLTHEGQPSAWWLPAEAVEEIRRLQRDTKLSFEEVVRATCSLAFDFQGKCAFELRARLLVPIYAFIGPISRESLLVDPYAGRGKKFNPELSKLRSLSGYLNQLFVPNLKSANLSPAHWAISGPSGAFSLIT
jgi:hypothetical protein